MLEETSLTVFAEHGSNVLSAHFGLVLPVEGIRIFLDKFVRSVGELALIVVSTLLCLYPVLAHLCLEEV